jgi:proton-dependent oligopeptide transporter, POT family
MPRKPPAHTPAQSATPQSDGTPPRTSHPIALWFFFWGEFAERCSFYGAKAILLLYMIERLGFEKGTASGWMNSFKGACYFLPLAGGFLADNFLGKYRTIVVFSVPYILGHVILGFENVPCLLISLALLAMGAGSVKPNLSTLMGMTYDQQRPGQTQLRSDAFAMFYFAINTGSFASSFAVPLIRNTYGYRIAFLFPAALMVVAFLLFVAGRPFYAKETVRHVRPAPRQRREQRPVLRKILGLFVVVIFFWSVIEQYDNTWILFARDHVNLNIFDYAPDTWQAAVLGFVHHYLHVDLLGKPLVADQFQVLNAIFVVLLVPVVAVVWRLLDRAGLKLRPTDKMLIGFVLTLATPLILAIAGARADAVGRISAWWLVSAYFVITTAEVCISVVGLELAFTAAPESMKSIVTACWLLTMSCGDFLNALITPYYERSVSVGSLTVRFSPCVYFSLFTLMMIPVVIAFVLVARRFNALPAEKLVEDSLPKNHDHPPEHQVGGP